MQITDIEPLLIAGFVVPIKVENHHLQVSNLLGRYLGDEPRIILRDDVSPQMIAETLLHEVIHAIIGLYLEGHEDVSEHVVAMIAQGMFQVLQANQEFTKYVSGDFEDEPTDCRGGDECPSCESCKCTEPTETS